MKILTRYILKEMIGPTALGFAFYTSIILMQSLFALARSIIQQSLSIATVGRMLLLSLPHIVVLTIPMSLLFGILIAIGRLSSDSEIIAMRALGISTRSIYRPVFLFSLAMFALNLYLINVVFPKGNAQLQKLRAELAVTGAQKEILPRVFYDSFENVVVYVNDVDPHTGSWKGVFVADNRTEDRPDATTPQKIVDAAAASRPDTTAGALGQRGGPKISVAERGSVVAVRSTHQVWLNLNDAFTHVWDPRRPDRYDVNRNATQRVLLGDRSNTDLSKFAKSLREMNLRELWAQQRLLALTTDRETYNLAWVEIHKKFSIPFACLAFGVLGLPLGMTNRRGGRSSGFTLSIAIILVYYVIIYNGEALAGSGRISPFAGMWTANILLLALGIYLLWRASSDAGAERAEGGPIAKVAAAIRRAIQKRGGTTSAEVDEDPSILTGLDITFPNTIDRYVLREFGKTLGMVMLSTAALTVIIDYTEIASDIRANNIPVHVVFAYYRFFIFRVINWTLPISVLVATLVTFGILSKNNEVTAIKSSGVSLYRVSLPILAIAVLMSVLAYLLLDFVLPYSNQRTDEIRSRIKHGQQAAHAASEQQKLWMVGKGRYLINFLTYDRNARELRQVQIFELHPSEFRVVRRVYAQEAKWTGHGWKFRNGWMRSFSDRGDSTFSPITTPIILQYAEKPSDFETEARTPDQMTYAQLRRYVDTIRRAGYSAEELTVRLYMKTSWPALCIVMALIALPFAFRIGKRGALYGIGIALVLGIVYWMVYAIFTKFGEVGNLPPLLSAWSGNILFAIAAVYMFLSVET